MEDTVKRFLFSAGLMLCCATLCVIPNTLAQVSSISFSSPSGSFSTPTYPSQYPPATEYVWQIKAKDGMHIKLTFDVIDIEAYRGKCIDIVEIKDGDSSDAPLLGGYCNAKKPTDSIMSSSKALRIWFLSARNSDGGAGFNASYVTLKDEGCGGQLQSFPGSFHTPHYPSPYPNNHECTWNIVTEPGKYIHLKFHGIYHLEGQCFVRFMAICVCKDILDIKDGNKLLPYAPQNGYCFSKPRAFTSKTNSISVKFITNNSGRFEGFNATYSTSLTPECGADLHNNNGVITSPNFPHSYLSFKRCIWRITVQTGHYISLKFLTFDVQHTDGTCFLDSVLLYDGYTKNSRLLAKLCNANAVNMVNSTGNELYILFQAWFNSRDAKGFKATYSSHLKVDAKTRKPRHEGKTDLDSSVNSPSNIALHVTSTSWKLTFGFLGILALIL